VKIFHPKVTGVFEQEDDPFRFATKPTNQERCREITRALEMWMQWFRHIRFEYGAATDGGVAIFLDVGPTDKWDIRGYTALVIVEAGDDLAALPAVVSDLCSRLDARAQGGVPA
jgi:hypothetical protein